MIEVMRALPAKDVLGTLGEHSLESHIGHQTAYLIIVDKAGVTEYLGFLTEKLVYLVYLTLYLLTE